MSILDRRRFLCSAATIATIGSVAQVSGYRDRTTQSGWEWSDDGRAFSSVTHARRVDDGYLLVGTAREEGGQSEGLAVKLDRNGAVNWTRRYPSPDQLEALEDEGLGPIPQDGLSFALEAGSGDGTGGFLLVGWTYFDNTAVYVARLVRVDSSGEVLWERSLSELEGASAYSFLADGVETDDGYLLCGIESPGIMLGGAGWVVSVDHDGDLNWHRRYPATDRDLEQTGRQDLFRSITPTDGGYVLSGHFDPAEANPGTAERAWLVGIDEDGDVRWDDRFDLGSAGSTRAYDVVESESSAYDVVVVGATGPNVRRGDRDFDRSQDPTIDGDGFFAAYTDDGNQVWLRERDETPVFSAASGPRGVVGGGVTGDRGWVGTADRTDFEAAHSSVVTTLTEAHGDGVLAAGRQTVDDRTEGWARLVTDIGADDPADEDGKKQEKDEKADEADEEKADEEPAEGEREMDDQKPDDEEPIDEKVDEKEPDDRELDDEEPIDESEDEELDDEEPEDDEPGDDEPTVEFTDCETVHIVGDFDDVMFDLVWWSEDGLIGTITEPVGPVDGERTINATEEFGPFTYGPILTSVELFEDETVATPGLGDFSRSNPNHGACEADIRSQLGADGIDDAEGLGSDETGAGDESDDADDGDPSDGDSEAESQNDSSRTDDADAEESETDD